MAPTTSHHLYPPFPEGITTAPLVSISLAKLEANDVSESKAFFDASKNLGFFYMNMEGSAIGEKLVSEAEELHIVSQKLFQLPNADKDKYKADPFFGYRHLEVGPTHEDGTRARKEAYNVRKDDLIGNCKRYPNPPLIDNNWQLFKEFAVDSRAAIDIMITHLERNLNVPIGTIANLHRNSALSGDHVRFNSSPVLPYSETAAKQGEHTDFGTLTILFNWLAGLQIRLPETGAWVWVKPVPGSAIVNLGDALVKFSAGILRSNVHRVVSAPGPHGQVVRQSLVFFSRPEDEVVLKRLQGGAIDMQPASEKEVEMTSLEWILRRSLGDLKGVYTHTGGLELRPPLVESQT